MSKRDVKAEMDSILDQVWGEKSKLAQSSVNVTTKRYVVRMTDERKAEIKRTADAMRKRLFAPG